MVPTTASKMTYASRAGSALPASRQRALQERAEIGFGATPLLADTAVDTLRVDVHRARRGGRVGVDGLRHHPLDPTPDLALARVVGGHEVLEVAEQRSPAVVEDGEDEIVLAAEVAVERAVRQPRARHDVAHPGTPVGLLTHDVDRGLHEQTTFPNCGLLRGGPGGNRRNGVPVLALGHHDVSGTCTIHARTIFCADGEHQCFRSGRRGRRRGNRPGKDRVGLARPAGRLRRAGPAGEPAGTGPPAHAESSLTPAVATVLGNRPEWVEVALASARLGARLVPASWRSTTDELDYLLGDSGAVLLVSEPGARADDIGPTLHVGDEYEHAIAEHSDAADPGRDHAGLRRDPRVHVGHDRPPQGHRPPGQRGALDRTARARTRRCSTSGASPTRARSTSRASRSTTAREAATRCKHSRPRRPSSSWSASTPKHSFASSRPSASRT